MFFDDEKDNIEENLQDIEISDSGTVSWDSILDRDKKDSDDADNVSPVTDLIKQGDDIPDIDSLDELDEQKIEEIVTSPEMTELIEEIASQNPDEAVDVVSMGDENNNVSEVVEEIPTQEAVDETISDILGNEEANKTTDDDDLFTIAQVTDPKIHDDNLNDEIVMETSETDDVNDDELMDILSEEPTQVKADKQNISDVDLILAAPKEEDTTSVIDDTDEKLAQVASENDEEIENEDNLDVRQATIQKKNENKKPSLLIPAVLFILIVLIGGKFLLDFVSERNMEKEFARTSAEKTADGDDIDADVPVHNEDTLDQLEADAIEPVEVIDVIPTGRTNPFLPLDKYVKKTIVVAQQYDGPTRPVLENDRIITKTKVINTIDFDSAKIPKPPAAYGDMSEIATKLMSISVSGIMYDSVKPSAIITLNGNDYFVQIGDRLDNFKIIGIGRDNVQIALGKNIYKASVGEQFKITDFYGIQPYYKDKKGSGRQYWSSLEEYNDRLINQKKYTSANDVPIYVK